MDYKSSSDNKFNVTWLDVKKCQPIARDEIIRIRTTYKEPSWIPGWTNDLVLNLYI